MQVLISFFFRLSLKSMWGGEAYCNDYLTYELRIPLLEDWGSLFDLDVGIFASKPDVDAQTALAYALRVFRKLSLVASARKRHVGR